MSYSEVRDTCFGKYCRQCINQVYRKKLKTKDCVYFIYPSKCARCEGIKNIVNGVSLSGFFKLLI